MILSSLSYLLAECPHRATRTHIQLLPASRLLQLGPRYSQRAQLALGVYTVGADNTCDSIAKANSLPTDRFISAASYFGDYICTSVMAGNQVCMEGIYNYTLRDQS